MSHLRGGRKGAWSVKWSADVGLLWIRASRAGYSRPLAIMVANVSTEFDGIAESIRPYNRTFFLGGLGKPQPSGGRPRCGSERLVAFEFVKAWEPSSSRREQWATILPRAPHARRSTRRRRVWPPGTLSEVRSPGAADLTFGEQVRMETKRHSPEEIIAKLRQVEALRSKGQTCADAVQSIGVSEVTYRRWRAEFGGLLRTLGPNRAPVEKPRDT